MKGDVAIGIEPKTRCTSKSILNEHIFFYQSTA
jgi:hypothetical protein